LNVAVRVVHSLFN